MGVAVVEDANGVRSVLVSTSEPRGYLRPEEDGDRPRLDRTPKTWSVPVFPIKYGQSQGVQVIISSVK